MMSRGGFSGLVKFDVSHMWNSNANVVGITLIADTASALKVGASIKVYGISPIAGSGAGDFASITGDPTDNAALVAWGATLAGAVVTYNSYLSTAADSTALGIPVDGSIPQISEGKALGSVTITPKYASSIIELELSIGLSSCSASSHSSFFAFKDADADTIGGGVTYFAAGLGRPINVRIIVPASSTAARTYSWRYGSQGGTGATQYINSLGGTQTHGATTQVYITAKEIKQ
jgi:hypothetical protein